MRMSTVSSQMVAMGGRPSMTPSSTTASTSAVRTRCLSTSGRLALLLAGQTIAPFARRERVQRRLELGTAEIRPQRVAHVQLGIGQVPQQEIADAVVATGADEEVRIADFAQRELAREAGFVDGLGTQRAG